MTSRQIEDQHTEDINQILEQAGIRCLKSPPVSTESGEEAEEEELLEEVKEETQHEASEVVEEEHPVEEASGLEEERKVFPSPSLRKILPDEIREFEKINRVHVLPEEFNTFIDPAAIPKIAATAPKEYIDALAELVGCKDYSSSMAEFWFLDTLANLLRRCQADGFDRESQAILVLWWCEFMKELEQFDAADRTRFLRRFKENMLAAATYVAEEEHLPTPVQAGVDYRAPPSEVRALTVNLSMDTVRTGGKNKSLAATDTDDYRCGMCELTSIIHYFYDLFSTDYQFELVRSIFTTSPEYAVTDAPHRLHAPRCPYAPVKVKGKKEPKKEKKKEDKKKIPDTAEYIELMQLKQREEEELQILEQKEAEEWERKNHILPLGMSVDDAFFDKYWPVPVIEEEVAQPDKKSKKK